MGMLLHRHDFGETDKKVSPIGASNKTESAERLDKQDQKDPIAEDPVRRGRKRKD